MSHHHFFPPNYSQKVILNYFRSRSSLLANCFFYPLLLKIRMLASTQAPGNSPILHDFSEITNYNFSLWSGLWNGSCLRLLIWALAKGQVLFFKSLLDLNSVLLIFSPSFWLEDHSPSRKTKKSKQNQSWEALPFLSYLLNITLPAPSRSSLSSCCKCSLKNPFGCSEQTFLSCKSGSSKK